MYVLHSSLSDCASVSLCLDFVRYSARSDWCLLCKRCFSHSARRWQSLHRASSLDQHCSLQTRFEHAVQCSMSTPCRPHPQHPFQRCAISSSLSSAGSRRGGLSSPVALLSRRCLLLRLSCSSAGTVLTSAGSSGPWPALPLDRVGGRSCALPPCALPAPPLADLKSPSCLAFTQPLQ